MKQAGRCSGDHGDQDQGRAGDLDAILAWSASNCAMIIIRALSLRVRLGLAPNILSYPDSEHRQCEGIAFEAHDPNIACSHKVKRISVQGMVTKTNQNGGEQNRHGVERQRLYKDVHWPGTARSEYPRKWAPT